MSRRAVPQQEQGLKPAGGLCIRWYLSQQGLFGRGKFFTVVAARKQMAIDIHRQGDRGVAHEFLDNLGLVFNGEVLQGEQPAIIDHALFNAVQAKLDEQLNSHNSSRMKSEALLAGIFDDRGNRMSPSRARKRGIK